MRLEDGQDPEWELWPRAQRISEMQLELPLLSAIGITGLKFAIHSGMAGWLWALPARCLRGSKHHQQKREPAERARRKVPVGLLVCIRAETLVSTALPTSLCCLRFKWDAISALQCTLHLPCNLTLCFSLSANPSINGSPLESASCLTQRALALHDTRQGPLNHKVP